VHLRKTTSKIKEVKTSLLIHLNKKNSQCVALETISRANLEIKTAYEQNQLSKRIPCHAAQKE
jgi:hypothetical protein